MPSRDATRLCWTYSDSGPRRGPLRAGTGEKRQFNCPWADLMLRIFLAPRLFERGSTAFSSFVVPCKMDLSRETSTASRVGRGPSEAHPSPYLHPFGRTQPVAPRPQKMDTLSTYSISALLVCNGRPRVVTQLPSSLDAATRIALTP